VYDEIQQLCCVLSPRVRLKALDETDKKVKKGIAVCRQACHHRYGNSHAIWDHTVLPAIPPLPQPKLVLDLATPEGYKAELTQVVG